MFRCKIKLLKILDTDFTDGLFHRDSQRKKQTENYDRKLRLPTKLLSPKKDNGAQGFYKNVGIQKKASVFDIIQIVLKLKQTIIYG